MPRYRVIRVCPRSLRSGLGLVLAVAGPAVAARAQPQEPSPAVDEAMVDSIVSVFMQRYDVPGLGLALVRDREVVLVKGYGIESARTGRPVTARTVFSAGSLSKSVTAAIALRMTESGRLDLDAPVTGYLSPPGTFRAFDDLTLRHLLSHTSGYPPLPEWPLSTRQELVERLATVERASGPGAWAYSNQNFILAGYVLESVARRPYEELARALLLDPLGMEHQSFGVTGLRSSEHAVPHRLDVLRGQVPVDYEGHLDPWSPSGGLNLSAEDLGRYVRFQLTGLDREDRSLLSPESMAEMHRPHATSLSRERFRTLPVEEPGYALGWYTSRYRDLQILEHTGTLNGFTASIVLVPAAGAGVGMLTNGDHADGFVTAAEFSLLERLLQLEPLHDVEAWVNERSGFDPEERRRRLEAARSFAGDRRGWSDLTGTYEPPGGQGPRIRIELAESGLRLHAEGMFTLDLVPFEPNGFLANSLPAVGVAFRFEASEDGSVRLLGEGQLLAIKAPRS